MRQRKLPIWDFADPRRRDLIGLRLSTANQYAFWAKELSEQQKGTIEEIAANGILALLAATCGLLDKQLATQAAAFQNEGGFTQRLYRVRSAAKQNRP